MKPALSLLAVLLAASILGAGASMAGPSRTSAATVKVTLVEFKLTPSTRTVAAGRVTFVVTNRGKLHHEFVVLKTPTAAAKLQMDGMTAVENGNAGKIATLVPGATKRLSLNLPRGHYVLLCNLTGHYQAGQHADLTVK